MLKKLEHLLENVKDYKCFSYSFQVNVDFAEGNIEDL